MKIGDLQPFTVGDRFRVTPVKYRSFILEVARIEERGVVCDLMEPRGDGTWRNHGHRFLYEWHEVYPNLEKL